MVLHCTTRPVAETWAHTHPSYRIPLFFESRLAFWPGLFTKREIHEDLHVVERSCSGILLPTTEAFACATLPPPMCCTLPGDTGMMWDAALRLDNL